MPRQRLRIRIEGTVQGVGFRPFLYRLAVGRGLGGWVRNEADSVLAELEGEIAQLEALIATLGHSAPPGAVVERVHREVLPVQEETLFAILASSKTGQGQPLLPDAALCADCAAEMHDPANRRYCYPFITCNACGPRLSMLVAGPFDRARSSMRRFAMCPDCRREYEDPGDRRFHAQSISCPNCGPHLWLAGERGMRLADDTQALEAAIDRLRQGGIVAVKGIGGFHLICRADDAAAVERLRQRKRRPSRPLAVMFTDMGQMRRHCRVSSVAEVVLQGAAAPVVLLPRRSDSVLPEALAPGLVELGAMLPYSPLHHLLARGVDAPLVATSGNLSGSPICYRNHQALAQLAGIADAVLLHDRAIVRPLEDSVARIVLGVPLWLRLGRGNVPLTLPPAALPAPTLAMGGHMKAAVAVGDRQRIHVGPFVGEALDGLSSRYRYRCEAHALPRLFGMRPQRLVADAHPDWASAREARRALLPMTTVQHHHAHVRAVMGEHGLTGPVLGIAWDGTGWGEGGEIRGSECLQVGPEGCRRLAALRSFVLPGGEAAIRHPARLALAMLHAAQGEQVFDDIELQQWLALDAQEQALLRPMLTGSLAQAACSSAGRLFDAVSALLGICRQPAYEGEAAMRLEAAVDHATLAGVERYPFELEEGEPMQVDWRPMLRAMDEERRAEEEPGVIAARFHRTLAAMLVAVARRACLPQVVLSGGCFQNAILLELAVQQLHAAGFEVYRPRRLPPNDGALAVGQLYAAGAC